MLQDAIQEKCKKFKCDLCSFECSRKNQYIKHISTTKHQNATKMLQNATFTGGKAPTSKNNNNKSYDCACGKMFNHSSSYYRHRNNCFQYQKNLVSADIFPPSTHVGNNSNTTNVVMDYCKDNEADFKELIVLLLKENKEFQHKFLEVLPQLKGNAEHSYNNTNSHNTNNFNIQMFLNEHCKNAMNLTDFIDSLPITNETYDHTIENGLTKTITHMITDGLNNMDILERPIHCTDASRKTMYVKDNDVWEKDVELNGVLMGIKKIALKQRTMINKWKDANRGWEDNDNLQSKLTSLVFNSMTDIENDQKETNKIIRAISKNTYLTNEIKEEYK